MERQSARCTEVSLLAIALAAIPGIYFLMVTTLDIRGLVNGNGNVVGEDFAQIWLGGRLALEGRIHDIFVPELFRTAARAEFVAPHVPQIFSYPPTTLLPAVALALLPYPDALGLWSLLQVGLLVMAVVLATRGFLPKQLAILAAITSPALALTLPWGQFGAIVAALMTMGVLLLDRHPVVAGALLGLIAVKPQFGLLVPVALLAGRHWRAFAAAGLTVLAMVVLTVPAFGIGAWSDFLQVTLPAQIAITSDPAGYLPIAHSVRDRLVIEGFDPTAARVIQSLLGCLAFGAVVLTFGRGMPPARGLFVLAAGTVAALPYVAIYDQAVVAVAALAAVAAAEAPDRSLRAVLLFLWASPVVDLWLTMSGLPQVAPFIGPVAILMLLGDGRLAGSVPGRRLDGARP
jgi:hypothetical protein